VVSLTKDLQFFVDKQPVKEADLSGVFASYKKIAPELTIVLHVDRTVAIQNVVSVMDVAQKLNIKLVLATEPK
jgi:biopolymer transport protein ExbD